jgi:hypothetical protein
VRQHGSFVERIPGGVFVCAFCRAPVNHIGGPCPPPTFEGLLDRVWIAHLKAAP